MTWNVELLEEIIRDKQLDIGLSNDIFFYLTSEAKATQTKKKKWDYNKLKSFNAAIKPTTNYKGNPQNGRKY